MANNLIDTSVMFEEAEVATSIRKVLDKSRNSNAEFRPHVALADTFDETVRQLSMQTGLDEVSVQKALFSEIITMYGSDIADEVFEDYKDHLGFVAEWEQAVEGGLEGFMKFHREKTGDDGAKDIDLDDPEAMEQLVERLKQLIQENEQKKEDKENRPPISW